MSSLVARTGRAVRRRRVDERFDSRLAWILGSPRSGSTWLWQLLAEHPAVVPVNEPLIGMYLSPFLCDLPGVTPAGLDFGNFTMRKVQAERRFQFFADEFRDVWLPQLGTLMRERFHAHAVRYPPDVPLSEALVLIKEPNGSQSADLIMSALPGARLLFLLRDGRDVVDSELAANLDGSWVTREFPGASGVSAAERGDFIVQSAHKWLWRTEAVQLAFREHSGPKLLVRYEDLLGDTSSALREIYDWLELPVSDAELDSLVDRYAFENVPAERRGSQQFWRAARPGLWRESLSADEQRLVSGIIGEKLAELGYE